MLVLDQSNSYSFSNMVVKVTDNTIITNERTTPTPDLPDFNVLIPTVQEIGSTNAVEIYYPGEYQLYLANHGNPNPLKYGFGPDMIYGILQKSAANVGVYTVNLRGESATIANTIVLMKYRVEKDVPYTDESGNPYYVDKDKQLTTDPTDATAVVRDVLHVKFVTGNVADCKKWTDLHKGMNNVYSDVEDDQGYKTMPLFGVMYRGASAFGNNVYFNMVPKKAEYDGNMYYQLTVFDGQKTTTTDAIYSLDLASGEKYNTSYFIETLFNETFPTLRLMTAETINDLYELFNQYAGTIDDYISGSAPSKNFAEIDPFAANEFQIITDEGSLNSQIANAFTLTGGDSGTETADELFEKFFKGEIITDVASVLRYKVSYIPDVNYNEATKRAIVNLIKKRNRMTTATLMIGGSDSFASALIDHQANYYDTMPNIRQLAKVQSPMMYNTFVRRTITYPPIYFDVMAMMDHFIKYGNYFQPFAGALARWTGYIEDTMPYPTESPEFINSLQTNRINVVMKDSEDGAYLADQLMNTQFESDQTELNNAFMISCMLYDLLWLVHRNHFKFNEAEQVRIFKEAVNDYINNKYAQYSASLSCEVSRMGTIGRARYANKIVVTIDMRDINKFTDVEIVLTDE